MKQSILNGLIEYNAKGSYPWHMPGHKRRLQTIFPEIIENPFSIDVTEVDGLDEFHCPTGIIEEAFTEAAKVYGSDESFYLVNGSTSGILAAISSLCKIGDSVIVARNCHTSVYHAIRLLHLKPVYITPEWNDEYGMFGGVEVDTVKKAVKNHPQAKAVILVSPTYEGVVSDIEKIAKITHKSKMPLIVDEAHGAHFEYMSNANEAISNTNYKELPKPAIRLGADIVIESLHKTLPAMTQCAILHIKGNYINRDKLKEYLSIYQSSSPSYVFMATMEACIEKMDHERDGLFIIYKELLTEYRKKWGNLRHIHLMEMSDFKKTGAYSYDIGKLVFSVKNCGYQKEDRIEPFTGVMLGKILNEEYGQMVEMMADSYIIAMTSIADTKEAFEALYAALEVIDNQLTDMKEVVDIYEEDTIRYTDIPEYKIGIAQAREAMSHEILLRDAAGKISSDYVYVYPPGIPIIAPGEIISRDLIIQLMHAAKKGLNIKGLKIDNELSEKNIYQSIKISVVQDNKWISGRKFFNRG